MVVVEALGRGRGRGRGRRASRSRPFATKNFTSSSLWATKGLDLGQHVSHTDGSVKHFLACTWFW